MTIKEISSFTGKTERTIRTWISKSEGKIKPVPYEVISQGIPYDYSIDDVECILLFGSMSKDAVSILMQNARREITQIIDYEIIGKMIGVAITAAMTPLINQLQNIQKPTQLLLEHVPEKPLRAVFVEKMKEFVSVSGRDYRDAYHYIYDEIGSIYTIRVMARAKNRGITGVDVLESDGYLNKGISVIIKLIKTLEEGV